MVCVTSEIIHLRLYTAKTTTGYSQQVDDTTAPSPLPLPSLPLPIPFRISLFLFFSYPINYFNSHYTSGTVQNDTVSVRVGLTSSFIDETFADHDIEKIEILADATERTEMLKGNLLLTDDQKPLINVDWSGYKISDGDELYHTVWDNVEGKTQIKRPSEIPTGTKFDIDSFNYERIGRAGLKALTSQPEYWLYTARIHPDTLDYFLSKEKYEEYCVGMNVHNDSNCDDNGVSTNDMDRLMKELRRRGKLAKSGSI